LSVDVSSTAVIERLQAAINRQDIDALMDCFEPDVRNEVPTRPHRGFRGREELRGYWEQVIGGHGHFEAKLLRSASHEDTAWAEWCWHGERSDGTPFARAGVTIYGLRGDRIAWMRLYMEPVEGDPVTVGSWIMHELSSP
jgi:ketosteroid isomerase-like protein